MSAGKCSVCVEDKDKLVSCGRCGNRQYCGPTCQRKDWPEHKTNCTPRKQPSWKLKLTLPDSRDPQITRTIICPDTSTFEQLHQAIQISFNWASTHSYDFVARDPTAEEQPVLDIAAYITRQMAKQKGEYVDPGPRQNFVRVTNPSKQQPFGSMVDTMHEKDRMHPETPEKSAANLFVGEQFRKKEYHTAEWEYTYDFGDKWGHEIEIVGRGNVDDSFQCIDGHGHGIAEDAGSTRGWEEIKAAYKAVKPTKEQKEKMTWFEREASNADPKGLKGREGFWDKDTINMRLRNIR